ncbi:MAG: methyltransferase domain-containing protein [Limisphaerales bacterium]
MKGRATRAVEPELLDNLPPRDARALRSRRDLRRLNVVMGHPKLMARALLKHLRDRDMLRIVELGAGDGRFFLEVASRLRSRWQTAQATLVDRLDAFAPELQGRFQRLGWALRTDVRTASEWLQQSPPVTADAIICNLFLHQFPDDALAELLRLAARATSLVIALEPRRSPLSRMAGRLLWMIGCGPVTRHDAGISIRAGFLKSELSAIWPDEKNWALTERSAGLFSHLFIARRKSQ